MSAFTLRIDFGRLNDLLGNRLTVDPRTLTALVQVRILVPQPFFLDFSIHALAGSSSRDLEYLAFELR